MRDELGLFSAGRHPLAATKTGGFWSWFVVGVLVGALACMAVLDARDRGAAPDPNPTPVTAGKTLIFIHERLPLPLDEDMLLREMPAYCEQNNLQYRAFDDDTPDEPIPSLIEWAKSRGVEPPMVVLTDEDDKAAKVIDFPKTVDGLKELFR